MVQINKSNQHSGSLMQILKSRNMSRYVKLKLYKIIMKPVVVLRYETRVRNKSKRDRRENTWERQIYGGKKLMYE